MNIRDKHMRFKLTDPFGNLSYIEVYQGKWSYFGKGHTPYSLSNTAENAAEFGFAMTDAVTYDDLVNAIRKHVHLTRRVEYMDGQRLVRIFTNSEKARGIA